MFTKKDYDNYFEQLARVERKMAYSVYELGGLIKDPSIVAVLKKVGEDEVRHYGYVLKMLELTADPRQPEDEHRDEPRKRCLGTVLLRNIQDQEAAEINARCVDLSTRGICLECAEEFLPGDARELEIQLLGENEVVGRRGSVVWCKEIETDLYRSGIEFGP